ncbi:MAG TPA: c-type cytochrome biogenesis protein CcmI, partial [Albitalea sp.]|nr:c-type cytochrome biogenesis protein CcmI [Albitalea sp.]
RQTMMGGFLFAAVALVGVTVLLLLRPWRRSNVDEVATTRELNAGIYRDQLSELERDLSAGTIASADYEQARAELQRRLLDDTALTEVPTTHAARKHGTSMMLAIAVPLLATGLYAWLGTPAALQPGAAEPQHQVTAAEIDQMLNGLAARLAKNPDDPKGWVMLARSYRVLGRLPEAQNAFEHVGDGLNRDAVLLAEYADVLAANSGGNLEGKPLELVMTALKLDPDNGMALSLAATAAYKRRDFPTATLHWERLLKQLPPESDDAKWLVKTLAEIRDPNAKAAPAVAAAPAAVAPATKGGATVSGRVSLAPALAAKTLPTDFVFVFARAAEGPRMPLAVQRARVSDLPLNFKLDDSMAVSPDFKLSSATKLRIEARISRSGNATPAAGDLIGASDTIQLGAADVSLKIDQVRP